MYMGQILRQHKNVYWNWVFRSLQLLLRLLPDEFQLTPVMLAKYKYVLGSRLSLCAWFPPHSPFIVSSLCLWCLCIQFVPMPCHSKPTVVFWARFLTSLNLNSVRFPACKMSVILCPLYKVIWMMSGSNMLILFSRSVDLLHQKLQCVSDTLALQECWFWPQVSSGLVALLQYLWAKPFNHITNNLL